MYSSYKIIFIFQYLVGKNGLHVHLYILVIVHTYPTAWTTKTKTNRGVRTFQRGNHFRSQIILFYPNEMKILPLRKSCLEIDWEQKNIQGLTSFIKCHWNWLRTQEYNVSGSICSRVGANNGCEKRWDLNCVVFMSINGVWLDL